MSLPAKQHRAPGRQQAIYWALRPLTELRQPPGSAGGRDAVRAHDWERT